MKSKDTILGFEIEYLDDNRSAFDRIGDRSLKTRRGIYKVILLVAVIVISAFAVAYYYQNYLKSFEVDRKLMLARVYQANGIQAKHYKVILTDN